MNDDRPATRLLVHIGTQKTGTSSIQATLRHNVAMLVDDGVHVLSSATPGFGSVLSATVDHPTERRLRSELARVVDRYSPRLIVLSDEGLSTASRRQIARLGSILESVDAKPEILCYLRPQHERALSGLSQRVRAGATSLVPFEETPPRSRPLRYDKILHRWAATFGDKAIAVRVYPGRDSDGPNVLDDFLAFCGVGAQAELDRRENDNVSLSATALDLLAELNARGFPSEEWRRAIVRSVASVDSGTPPFLPMRADAAAFFREHADINEAVRQRFRPDLVHLFTPDFSRFPDGPLAEIDHELSNQLAVKVLGRLPAVYDRVCRQSGAIR